MTDLYVCPHCTKEFQAQKECDRCKGECLPIAEDMLDKAPLRDLLFAIGTAIGTDFFDWARNIIQDHPESELVPRITSELNRLEKELKDEVL